MTESGRQADRSLRNYLSTTHPEDFGIVDLTIAQAARRFVKNRSASCNARTLAWYESELKLFADWFKAHGVKRVRQLSKARLEEFDVDLKTRYSYELGKPGKLLSPITIRKKLLTLHTFLHWCRQEKLTRRDLAVWLPLPKFYKPLPKAPSPEVLRQLFAVSMSPLERALIYLLYDTGLRLGEVIALDLADVDVGRGIAYVRHGKGDKPRAVVFECEASGALSAWLSERKALAASGETAFFVNAYGLRLTDLRCYKIVKRVARRAGVEQEISPHRLRHGFTTDYLDAETAKVYDAQAQLGHESIVTTMGYFGASVGRRRKAHARCSPLKRLLSGELS